MHCCCSRIPVGKDRQKYTVSVALPGSILDNTQSTEMRTYLVGQVARAMVIYNANEIVVFDEHPLPRSG